MCIYKLLIVWFVVSIPASLGLCALIRWGRGPEWNDKEREMDLELPNDVSGSTSN